MEFEWDDQEMLACQEMFNGLEPEDRIVMSHYELARATEQKDSAVWKRFITEPRVSQWIDSEMEIFKSSQMKKVIGNANEYGRSVGAAQMITALNKTMETTKRKDGPVFIYSYVPLSSREIGVDNAQVLPRDIFE